jgi:hypothetical protein
MKLISALYITIGSLYTKYYTSDIRITDIHGYLNLNSLFQHYENKLLKLTIAENYWLSNYLLSYLNLQVFIYKSE